MKENNPIRRLRESLEMSQPEFARLLGRSHQSVGNYERGQAPPAEVIEKLKTIAAEHALADIALELSSDDWQVRHVLQPGERFITDGKPVSGNHEWHSMLDRILGSGEPDAIHAVQSNLVVFDRYVANRSPKKGTPASPKKRSLGGH